MFNYFIRNGFVIDGTSLEPVKQNIGILGDKITYIGTKDMAAFNVIDADGLYVAPGFIDVHGHSEINLLLDRRAEGKITQGITTEINGNCGFSAAPLFGEAFERRSQELQYLGIKERWHNLNEYLLILKKKGIALNFMTLCGHSNLRASVLGYSDTPADDQVIGKMKTLYLNSLMQGALGLSSGLAYPPAIYSDTEEIVKILSIRHPKNREIIYTSHIRSESEGLLESIEEIIGVGEMTQHKVHISHLKTSGEENWWKIDRAIELIEDARAKGVKITADTYPYIASSTDLDTILPPWVFVGGLSEEIRRLKDPQISKKIKGELSTKENNYWKNVYISSTRNPNNKWMEGKNLYEIALTLNKNEVDILIDIIVTENGSTGAIFFTMSADNLQKIIALPYVMIGTDSSARSFSGPTYEGKPHPRGFGTFPKFISYYVREKRLISLSEAINRVTALPARVFGIEKRGILREGFYADIVIFDYKQIKDKATYSEPFHKSKGVQYLFINGKLSVEEGNFTGVLAGRVLT